MIQLALMSSTARHSCNTTLNAVWMLANAGLMLGQTLAQHQTSIGHICRVHCRLPHAHGVRALLQWLIVQSLMYFSKNYLIKFGNKHKSLLLGTLSLKSFGAICTDKGYDLFKVI